MTINRGLIKMGGCLLPTARNINCWMGHFLGAARLIPWITRIRRGSPTVTPLILGMLPRRTAVPIWWHGNTHWRQEASKRWVTKLGQAIKMSSVNHKNQVDQRLKLEEKSMSFVGMIKTAIHKQFRNQIKYSQSLRGGLFANVRNAMSRLVI